MAGRNANEIGDEAPGSGLVHGMVGQQSGGLVGVDSLQPPLAKMRHGGGKRGAGADESTIAAPVDDIDVCVGLAQSRDRLLTWSRPERA